MYTIDINKKNKAIYKIMEYYSSDNSLVSIEGYELIKLFENFKYCETKETEVLPRQTSWPKLNFYILPLTETNTQVLFKEIQSKELLHLGEGIIHIQISKNNKRVFIGCDNLHPECTVISGEIDQQFLDGLLKEEIINKYDKLKTST